jgi:hypothetical protein
MSRSLAADRQSAEVKSSHRDDRTRDEAVKELHQIKFRSAKARMGAAVERAIGDQPLKAFGHEGLLSGVCSGEKVPEYLARICESPAARRRFAMALLEDDPDVRFRTVIEIDERKAG